MIAHMDALFSKNVEDKEVYFKKNLNVEGVVEGVKNADSSSAEKSLPQVKTQIRRSEL